ncbi:MBL fold metallo-hydrolase [Verrucomicrobiota bacterium]
MPLKTCVLGSGSSGNCIYVASEQTRILIDAGLSCKETARRLSVIGVELNSINAVCVTHEHDDHVSSLGPLHRKTGVKLYANTGTIEVMERRKKCQGLPWNVFTTGAPFNIGDILITPFSVPHDSYDPVGFTVSHENSKLGIVTDMGAATELIKERLKHCQVMIVEANHDIDMLKNSHRPWSLKQRIASRQGHLSNEKAGELLTGVAGRELKAVFLAHLSSDCNRSEFAVHTVKEALKKIGRADIAIKLTYPDKQSEVEEI